NNTVTVSGATTFSAGTTSFNGTIAIPSGGTMSGGDLAGAANWNITGALNWSDGGMSGTGQTIIASGGTLALNGTTAIAHSLNRTLVNNGTATWTGSEQLRMAGGTFQNNGNFTTNS